MRLEVGDIRMDSRDGIAFGDDARASPQAARSASSWRRSDTYLLVTPAAWICAIAVSGFVTAGVLPPLALLAWLGLPALGLAIALAERNPSGASHEAGTSRSASALSRERCARVLAQLRRLDQASVDELALELRWPTDAVLDGLTHGVSSGQVDEDIDIDRGEYVYAVAEAVVLGLDAGREPATLQSVHERLASATRR